MKPKFRQLLQQSLTERAKAFEAGRDVHPPPRGWLQAVRTALGIPLRVAAARLHVSREAVKAMENREPTGAITLKSMAKAADALGCDFVYAVLPRGSSFQGILTQEAQAKAKALVESVGHSMALEQQGTGKVRQRIADVTAELVANPRRIWTEP